ncbi:MAG: ATP-binding protein [Bacteroidota bacterium]
MNKRGAKIQYDTLPNIDGVNVLIYQLFYNLINNSLKFSRPDQLPVIQIASKVKTDSIQITITDNGIGFDPEHNESIFNTFVRLNSKNKYDGTGLGLSLAKKIVERHHGTITAQGRMNEGAAFTMEFPVSKHPVL